MRYMLLITDDGNGAGPEEIAASPGYREWDTALAGRGIPHAGVRLRPEGAVVRVRGGETLVTDGPFAETTEQIAGFEIVECSDLDEAMETAAAHPSSAGFAIEIRPFPEA
ncbi:YciI family protein [Actinocorallia longicatena]|uniref:YciI family protein n=1 Tax=Actinocorallia longicatena TaxID=111803 RepID=A0ABP6QNC7_9ACTN